jgi:hypothetical protein
MILSNKLVSSRCPAIDEIEGRRLDSLIEQYYVAVYAEIDDEKAEDLLIRIDAMKLDAEFSKMKMPKVSLSLASSSAAVRSPRARTAVV